MESLLTVEQTAERLQLHRDTVRRQIKRGELRAVKRGRVWRVPESALQEATPPVVAKDTPESRAAAIQAELRCGDAKRRNAAIIRLAKSDARIIEIVTAAAQKAVEEWDGPEDDFSQWRALGGAPVFPEEAPDCLDGLYRADEIAAENS